MNRDTCIALIRTGSAKFCANQVKIAFGNASLADHPRSGLITCSRGRFRLSLSALTGDVLPAVRTFVGADDFGRATGVIDGCLAFRIPALQPSIHHDQIDTTVIQHFDFDRLDFSNESRSDESAGPVEVHGLLEDYKLIAREEQTTTVKHGPSGETKTWSRDTTKGKVSENWSYWLTQQENDVEFALFKSDGKDSHFDEEQRIANAFLKSIAFIHGQHAWPIWMQHRRAGKYVFDWVRPPRRSIRSPHRPFNERIWFNAKVGQITWNFSEALLHTFNFFLSESDLAKEIGDLLHQLREASAADTVKKVNNIVFCALLEATVNAIYANRVRWTQNIEEQEFERVRTAAIEWIRHQKSTSTDEQAAAIQRACERLVGKLSNTNYWHTREKFKAVVEELGLNWCGDWEDLYKFWNEWRHPVIHRGSRGTGEGDFATFKIQSRLAGAIHLLVLRSMGYSGIAIKSVFEDVFVNI